jgi:DNA-directed RNA polymerase specialized sigma24 family protein
VSERSKVKTHVEDVDKEIKCGLLGTEQQQEEAIRMARERYARPLASFIRERAAPTLDSDEVANAVNDAFIGLAKYAARGRFRADGALSTLLFCMARRKAYDQLRRRPKARLDASEGGDDGENCEGETCDGSFEARVNQHLVAAPEIAVLWKTAVDEARTNEIIRTFRLWISGLPRLQRKVAEAILRNFGVITNAQICDELAETGPRPSVASVKSARKQITEKFKELMRSEER